MALRGLSEHVKVKRVYKATSVNSNHAGKEIKM